MVGSVLEDILTISVGGMFPLCVVCFTNRFKILKRIVWLSFDESFSVTWIVVRL